MREARAYFREECVCPCYMGREGGGSQPGSSSSTDDSSRFKTFRGKRLLLHLLPLAHYRFV